MSPRRVHVIGVGKRVLEAALPAFLRARESFSLVGVHARSARDIEVCGQRLAVRPLAELAVLEAGDLVYLAVGKDAVPKVLAELIERGPAETDLLIDTPVVRFKHFAHLSKLRAFRDVWVPEDCSCLPWYDTLRLAVAAGAIGRARTLCFERSAYAYHGVAAAKAVLGSPRVTSARRRKLGEGRAERRLRLAGGGRVVILEPRDYQLGHFTLIGDSGRIGDAAAPEAGLQRLETIEADGLVRGFRIGDWQTQLDEDEASLTAGDPAGSSVTRRMNAMKRVGFLRILRAIASGAGGYPVADAIDDMVIDYHLEKLGLYFANPFTSPRSPLARGLLSLGSKLMG